MKKSFINSVVLGGCALTLLTGCGSREEVEMKLARGCEVAVKVMLEKDSYDYQISAIKDKKFGKSDGYTLVTIQTVTKNKEFGYDNERTFQCKFAESTGPFGINWKGALVQLKIGDDVYGSEGGELYGTLLDQMALTAAVEAAMR